MGGGGYLLGTPYEPSRVKLFETRKAARAYANERFGYIRERPDLRRDPHKLAYARADPGNSDGRGAFMNDSRQGDLFPKAMFKLEPSPAVTAMCPKCGCTIML